MDALIDLSPERFERREWAALQWVRHFLAYDGAVPDQALSGEFERLYSAGERTCIFAVFKLMFFFNMLANTVFKDKYATGTTCAIEPDINE